MTKYKLFAFVSLLCCVATALAEEASRIRVRAEGRVSVAADELRLPLQIDTAGDDIVAVKRRNDALLKEVFALAAAQKLPTPVVESTAANFDFEIHSEKSSTPFKGQVQQGGKGKDPFGEPDELRPPLHLGRSTTLRFAGLAEATESLAKLTAWESVRGTREIRLSPLQATVKDSAVAENQARRLAVKNARDKAALLAETNGLQLGVAIEVLDEDPSASGLPRGFPGLHADPFGRNSPSSDEGLIAVFVAMQAPKAAVDLDALAPAQLSLTVTVQVTYAALPRK